ncbi:MAG: nuclear transport factor 2 family protein [Gemmatimonadota bacterium]
MTFSPEALYAHVDECNWVAVCAMFTPDGVYERPGYPECVGQDAIFVFYAETRTLRGRHYVEGKAVVDDAACAWGRFIGSAEDGTAVT